jgi:hypothetical protein
MPAVTTAATAAAVEIHNRDFAAGEQIRSMSIHQFVRGIAKQYPDLQVLLQLLEHLVCTLLSLFSKLDACGL